MQKWNLDRRYAGQNEHTVGIRGSKMTFLRPPYHGEKDKPGRPGSKEKEIEFERKKYPSFQNRDAHALRFGSMNPISRFWGRLGIFGGSNMTFLRPPYDGDSERNFRVFGAIIP